MSRHSCGDIYSVDYPILRLRCLMYTPSPACLGRDPGVEALTLVCKKLAANLRKLHIINT